MSNRKTVEDHMKRINLKPKLQNSFSIPKKQNIRGHCSSKTMKSQQNPQENHETMKWINTKEIKTSSNKSTNSSTSSDWEDDSTVEMEQTSNGTSKLSSMDGDEYLTDTSVEKMRSSEFLSSDEAMIVLPASFSLGDLETFLPSAYSTPRFLRYDMKFQTKPNSQEHSIQLPDIPDDIIKESQRQEEDLEFPPKSVSPIQNIQLPDFPDYIIKESQESEEDMECLSKSISPEQNTQLPDIPDDIIKESQEQDMEIQFNSVSSEPSMQLPDIPDDIIEESQIEYEDTFSCSEAPSDGFRISKDLNQNTEEDFDIKDKCNKNNIFASTLADKSRNSISEKRESENNLRSSFEDTVEYSSGETMSTQKNSFNGKYNRINDSIIRWKQKNKMRNLLEYRSDTEDNQEELQKNPNKELQENEFESNKPQPVEFLVKTKVKLFLGEHNKTQQDLGILNISQSFTSLRQKRRNEGGNLHENINKSDIGDNLKNVQSIKNEELQGYESDNYEVENYIRQGKTNNRVTFVSVLKKSTNSCEKKNHGNAQRNFHEDVDISHRVENFDKDETPKRKGTFSRNFKLKFSDRIKTPRGKKHSNKMGNSLEDSCKNCSEDSFENVENIQNEESQNIELTNNKTETAAHQIYQKVNKSVEVDNMLQNHVNTANRSLSSFLNKQKNEGENSFEDMGENDNENSFKDDKKIQIKKFQKDKLNINHSQSNPLQINRKHKVFLGTDNKRQQDASIQNRSESFISSRTKRNFEEHLFEYVDKNDNEDIFENAQHIQNEEFQEFKVDNNQPETTRHHINGKTYDNVKQQNSNIAQRSPRSSYSKRNHKNKGKYLFEDIIQNDDENCFENFQKIPNKELQEDKLDSAHPKTVPLQINRKVKPFLGVDDKKQQDASILNISPNFNSFKSKTFEREHSYVGVEETNENSPGNAQKLRNEELEVNELENNLPDFGALQINNHVREDDNFEEAQNMEINTSKKKRRRNKGVQVKTNRRLKESRNASNSLNRSQKAANSLKRSQKAANSKNRSKNSACQEVYESVQNSPNSAENTNWPRCCIEAESKALISVPVLRTVFRDGVPIDSITLVSLGIESKRKCKH